MTSGILNVGDILSSRELQIHLKAFPEALESLQNASILILATFKNHQNFHHFDSNFDEPGAATTRSKNLQMRQPIAQIEASHTYLEWKNHHFQFELSNFTHNSKWRQNFRICHFIQNLRLAHS